MLDIYFSRSTFSHFLQVLFPFCFCCVQCDCCGTAGGKPTYWLHRPHFSVLQFQKPSREHCKGNTILYCARYISISNIKKLFLVHKFVAYFKAEYSCSQLKHCTFTYLYSYFTNSLLLSKCATFVATSLVHFTIH